MHTHGWMGVCATDNCACNGKIPARSWAIVWLSRVCVSVCVSWCTTVRLRLRQEAALSHMRPPTTLIYVQIWQHTFALNQLMERLQDAGRVFVYGSWVRRGICVTVVR